MDKELKKEIVEKMEKTLSIVVDEFATVKTGHASPAIVSSIKVDYYGTKTPLNQIASIAVPESHLIVIHPYEEKAIETVMKALQKSNMGLNPSTDGTVIRIPIPPLTEERRQELNSLVKRLAEDGRVSLRNIRREMNKKIQLMEKETGMSEDEAMRAKDKVQEITHFFADKIDKLFVKKEEEILNE